MSLATVATYSLTFTSVWLWLIVLLLLLMLGWTLLYYRRTNPMLGRKWRIALGVLRGLALALIFFVFAEPLLVQSSVDTKTPVVAVLVDNSASMSQNRHSSDQFQQINEHLRVLSQKLPSESRVLTYTVSDTIRLDGVVDGIAPVTALGSALGFVADDLAKDNLQAIYLLSDGASNLGPNPASVARRIGVPTTTIAYGDPNPVPDIRVLSVNCNPVGFVDKEFPVEVTLESRGFEGLRLPVRLKLANQIVAQTDVELLGNGRQQTVSLSFTPSREGMIVLESSTPVQQNEESDKNNSRQVQVKIRKSRIKILLAAAHLNWEFKAFRRALSSKEDFDVTAAVNSPRRLGGTLPFPENVDALSEFDALILYDFEPQWYEARRQLFDAFFDRTGKGAFVITAENFAKGVSQPLRVPMLPLQFPGGQLFVTRKETPFTLTERGKIHPLLQLAEDGVATQRLLNALPPFAGYLAAEPARAEAVVLAAVPPPVTGAPEFPLLTVQPYRSGKIACLSAFPLWKLDFLTQSFKPGDSTYVRLMENMVLWLVSREDVERIAINPEKPIFIAGEAIRLDARVFDESYQPIDDAEVEARLVSSEMPADSLVVSFRRERPGLYSATLHYLNSGDYKVSGTVKRNNLIIGKPTTSFVVEPYSLEDLSQVANFDQLKRIAELSGGRFYTVEQIEALPSPENLESRRITRRSEFQLFDNIYLLGFILLFLCAEWYLRKRYQLL